MPTLDRTTDWKNWYELNNEQKLQARDLDADVRKDPALYEYEVDRDGDVIDYSLIQFD